MDPEDEQTPQDEADALQQEADAADQAAQATVLSQIAATPETVRNTPEFKALERAARRTAREAGQTARQAVLDRAAAAEARQAAEAQRQAAIEDQVRAALGEDGIAAFQEIAELSETDPVAAAVRMREFGLQLAQSQATPPAAAGTTDPAGGSPVPAGTPPLPGGTVDPNAPLTPPTVDELDQLSKDLYTQYESIVERNQSLTQRNRVTMRDRANGFISYLGSAYTSAVRERSSRTRQ